MENVVIGIEGLVGAGKTSICKELVKILPNTILLNGGNLYRAIVYAMMKSGADLENLKSQASNIDIKTMMDLFKISYNVIISGRSIMQIYPKTNYHFFITASIDERAKRKSIQYNGEVNIEELKEHIIKRDNLQKQAGFYNLSNNTIEVDVTDCKTVEESTNKVLNYIKLPR